MRALALIFSLSFTLGLLSGCGAKQAAPKGPQHRVVSTSLCGDSYVLSLLPHDIITALSWQSDDNVSTAPQNFKGRPKAWDDAERLLALSPSLVVFGPGEGSAARPLLDKAGIRYMHLQWGEDFKIIGENTLSLASAAYISVPANDTSASFYEGDRPSILYLSPSGASAGPKTYVDAAIQRAGGKNIITQNGWHTPDLETMVALTPDLIITSFFKDGYASINENGMNNKILQDKINNTPHVNVPGKLWPCAGPGLYEASNIINQAIKDLK